MIWKISGMYCGVKEDQKDLVQDILLNLWKAYPGYDGSGSYSTWTYRIALNVAISYSRKLKTRKKLDMNFSTSINFPENSNQDYEILQMAIRKLKDLDRALVIMHLEGYKNGDISEVMGMSISNVSTRLNRIRDQLKNIILKIKKSENEH